MEANFFDETPVFILNESQIVNEVLAEKFNYAGAKTLVNARPSDVLNFTDHALALVVVKYLPADDKLQQNLKNFKSHNHSIRILLVHEFIDRGKIPTDILSHCDQVLEKPFTLMALEKAMNSFRFQPLKSKTILFYSSTINRDFAELFQALGADVINFDEAADPDQHPKADLAFFQPQDLSEKFRNYLKNFRKAYPDMPLMMLYNSQGSGTLDSEILNEIAYLFQATSKKQIIRKKIIEFFEQPASDRRKNPRKKNINQCWISSYNEELKSPDYFESPYLIDISHSGLSFQSNIEYENDQRMVAWIIIENHADIIVELIGKIRWKKNVEADSPNTKRSGFKYGVEFEKENSPQLPTFVKMLVEHMG